MSGKFYDIDNDEFSKLSACEYENKYVHAPYNNIADSFSNTRHTPWAKIKEYLQKIPLNNVLLDVGCGNGKNLNIFKGENHGCDACEELVSIAKKKCQNVKISNILNLSYDDNFADNIICIAVLHHLSSKERRIHAINELIRVCKTGGEILIYVWAKRDRESEQIVSFKSNNIEYNRYYHLFEKDELIELCEINNLTQIIDVYVDKENLAILIRKNNVGKKIDVKFYKSNEENNT
jgi:alkylated DNA repair protein alkB family protein 8